MRWTFPIFTALFLIVGIAACSPAAPTAQEGTSQAQPTATVHPLTIRTGIAEIDRVLGASGDVQKLRSLVQFTSTKCTRLDGLGGPPKCRAGEGEGTPVDVLPILGPEGSFLRRDEIRNWQGFEAAGIFAIYEVSPEAFSDENYPAGQYAVLFVGQEKQPAVSLRIRDGKIVRVDYIFDDSRESLLATLQREAARLILAPVA
jgi:hypothetical protein